MLLWLVKKRDMVLRTAVCNRFEGESANRSGSLEKAVKHIPPSLGGWLRWIPYDSVFGNRCMVSFGGSCWAK